MTDFSATSSDAGQFETYLTAILNKIATPQGFASLNVNQRKFLFAMILASVVPADEVIHEVETTRLANHLAQLYRLPDEAVERAISFSRSSFARRDVVLKLTKRIPDLLSIEDRSAMIGALWDIALCDKELHDLEERLIYEIADAVAVPRKKVAEELARAAARNQ